MFQKLSTSSFKKCILIYPFFSFSVFSQGLSDVEQPPEHSLVKRQIDERRVVCYYANWAVYRQGTAKFTPQNINPYLCTHLIYAFAGLGKDDEIQTFDKYQDLEKGRLSDSQNFVQMFRYKGIFFKKGLNVLILGLSIPGDKKN